MDDIVLILSVGFILGSIVGLTCLLICCIEQIKWRDIEECLIAMDRCYIKTMRVICCIRDSELEPRVIPQPELEVTQRYIPESTVIINPQNVITIGTECRTSETET